MTASSGQPYTGHGTPRLPIQPNRQPNINSAHAYTANAISSYANGHTLPTVHFTTSASAAASQPGPQTASENGFSTVALQPPMNGGGQSASPQNMVAQPLPIQAIRPNQPVVIKIGPFSISYFLRSCLKFVYTIQREIENCSIR